VSLPDCLTVATVPAGLADHTACRLDDCALLGLSGRPAMRLRLVVA